MEEFAKPLSSKQSTASASSEGASKKRKFSNKKRNTPAISPPLPGSSIYFQEQCTITPDFQYVGTFIAYAVAIYDPQQAEDVFESGFYGKGILSRSKPNWNPNEARELLKDSNDKGRSFHRRRFSKMQKVDDSPSLTVSTDVKTSEFSSFKEFLQLGLEEAFFLMYAFKCLRIIDESGNDMSVETCWSTFCRVQPRFALTYPSYHYYRSNDWTPKYGTKYGTDWILYRKGPTFYHAEKAIIVKKVEETKNSRRLTWLSLLNFNRVSEHVKKGLALCYVHEPKLASDEVISLDNLHLYQMEQIDLYRWVPSSTREVSEK